MPAEMRNYEEFKNNESIQADDNLKNLIKQIDEIKDTKNTDDDKIDGVFAETPEKTLNQGLLDSLNKQDIGTLQILVGEVGRIKGDSNLNLEQNVKQSLDELFKLLHQVLNQKNSQGLLEQGKELQESRKQSFNKFFSMIDGKKLDRLNTLKNREVEETINFVKDQINKGQAFDLFSKMEGADKPDNFKRTDRKNFDKVLDAIKSTYPELNEHGMDVVKNFKLDELFKDNHKAKDLVNLAKYYLGNENWNGEMLAYSDGLEGKFKGEGFSCQDFINKFNEINTERKNQNNEIVNKVVDNINISEDEIKNFKIEGGELKYNGAEFTQEMMSTNFKDLIDSALDKGDFINDNEKSDIIKQIYDKISEKINNKLGSSETPVSVDAPKSAAGTEYEMTDEDFEAMKDKLGERMFIEKGENEEITYNLEKAKGYLNSIKDTDWNDLKAKYGTPEGRAWISAVQILLNTQEGVDIKVDGKFGPETIEAVKDFQGTHSLKFKNGKEDENGEPDGLPGKVTMTKMLEILGGEGSQELRGNLTNHINEEGDLEQGSVEKIDIDSDLVNKLDLQEKTDITLENKEMLNIPDKTTVYVKNGDEKSYYYKSGNDIVMVSIDEPWIKKSTNIPGEGGQINTNIATWASKVDISGGGRSKLESIFKSGNLKDKISADDLNKLSILISESDTKQYQLNNDGIKISLNDEIFTKDFCGVSNIGDKLNLVYLASVVKNKFPDKDISSGLFGIKDADSTGMNSTNLIVTTELEKFGLKSDDNLPEFVNYCNKLKKRDDGSYSYENK